MIRRPSRSTPTVTLFPDTPLFRSGAQGVSLSEPRPDLAGGGRSSPELSGAAPICSGKRDQRTICGSVPFTRWFCSSCRGFRDRTSIRLYSVTNAHIVCCLLLEKQKKRRDR